MSDTAAQQAPVQSSSYPLAIFTQPLQHPRRQYCSRGNRVAGFVPMSVARKLEPLTVLAGLSKKEGVEVDDFVAPGLRLDTQSLPHAIEIGPGAGRDRVGIAKSIDDQNDAVGRQPELRKIPHEGIDNRIGILEVPAIRIAGCLRV